MGDPVARTTRLLVTVFLFLLGCTLTTIFTSKTFPFVALRWQFAGVAIAVVASIVIALKFFNGLIIRVHGSAPPVWLPGVASLLLCSSFYVLYERGPQKGLHPAVTLAGMLALELTAIAFIAVWSKRPGWGPHTFSRRRPGRS